MFNRSLYLVTFLFTGFAAASSHSGHETKEHTSTIKATVVKTTPLAQGQEVLLKLTRIKDDKPVSPNDLLEVHTEKVHLLIIDESLSDYHHIHPKPAGESGVYKFTWTPKLKTHYKLWVDLTPLNTKTQEYAVTDLLKETQDKKPIVTEESLETTVDGYTFTIKLPEEKLKAGKAAMVTVHIKDQKGPVTTLEPIMGAFAHFVGFGDDFATIAHLHPMGTEPTNEADRGGPDLSFHLEPEKEGILKLFAQVKIRGKEIFAPFTLVIGK